MKKKLILFVLIASALATLNSCKKDYLVKVNGIVQGTVRDENNVPLKDVVVTLDGVTQKTAITTDTLGYYKITGVDAGQHILLFSKAGYSVIRNTFTIQSPDQVANTTSGKKQSFVYYSVVNPSLHTLGGQLKGYVYYNSVALANAKVFAVLDESYEPNVYTTTTNDVGAYSFTKLPVGSNLTIISTHPTDPSAQGSITVATYNGDFITNSGVLLASDINLTSEPLDFVKGDYFLTENENLVNNAVDTAANIVLTFSDNVSQVITQNKGGYVQLRLYSNNQVLASTVTYSGNKITIDPVDYLTYSTRYYVNFKVYSTDTKYFASPGATTNMFYGFYAKARPAAALSGTPAITIVANALHLSTATTNAKGYDIYYSLDGKTEFLRVSTNNSLAVDYSIAAYATGSKFYIVPVTWDSNSVYTYGTQSNTVTK
jgi:hypothetical protein